MSIFKDNNVMKYCGNCGKKLVENAAFCAYCGFSLGIEKPREGQSRKLADLPVPTADQDYSTTHQEPRVPYTLYPREKIQPRPFLDNFKGTFLSPKTDLPLIASKPNLLQPFILNIIIGLLSGVAIIIMLTKVKITISPAFFESLTNDLNQANFDILQMEQMLAISTPLSAPIEIIIKWLLYSFVLWLLFSIFASDIASPDRNYKKMATITGWAQLPMIFQQITSILMYTFFLTDGEINYQSMTERVVTGGEISWYLNLLLQGIQTILLLWSILLIYYGVKSLGSMKTNPATISMIYGIIVFILTILLSFSLV